MKTLYLLTEDDFDSIIYEAFVERITDMTFTPVCRRMRKGSGLGAVRASFRLALAEIARMAGGSGVYFLVAMDNDRAPHAAASDALSLSERAKLDKTDARKIDRYAALVNAVEHLFPTASATAIPVAVAAPVEMIESWLLLIDLRLQFPALPRFARQHSASAHRYHHPVLPPPQLKDLREQASNDGGFSSLADWAFHLIMEKLDAAELATRSPSFALFKRWLDLWRPSDGSMRP